MALRSFNTRWIVPDPVEPPAELVELFSGESLFARLLLQRNIGLREQALGFLYADSYTPSDPREMPGMPAAIRIAGEHLKHRDTIGVWGDFDVDGQTATAIMVAGLRRLGANVVYRLPLRSTESHGLNVEGVHQLANQGVKLLITCDTGVSEVDAVNAANRLGMTTIITDHHAMPDLLPKAAAIVNSQLLPEDHPLRSLCGAGVAYKFIQALYISRGIPEEAESFLDLAAIGTIADLAPLIGDARYIVQRGLALIQQTPRAGLSALCTGARIAPASLTEDTISYTLAPRMNALSRLGDASPMIELLTTTDEAEAARLATNIEALNNERKQITDSLISAAVRLVAQDRQLLGKPVIILKNADWPTGVTGVVASHLADLYHKPVVIISTPVGSHARGSARSVEGINIIEALTALQDHLIRFGGHAQAAGFAIDQANLPVFERALQSTIAKQAVVAPRPDTLNIDAFVPLELASTPHFSSNLRLFRPFGPGNPGFVFAATSLTLVSTSRFGRDSNHRRLEVQNSAGSKFSLVWWNGAMQPLPGGEFDLAYQLTEGAGSNGSRSQFTVVAARPAEGSPSAYVSTLTALRVTDRRRSRDPLVEIRTLLQESPAIVFAEGLTHPPSGISIASRLQVAPHDRLIILTPPAGVDVLSTMVKNVNPQEIFVFDCTPDMSEKIRFMRFLSDRVGSALQAEAGVLNVEQLAAQSGHREKTVRKALQYLAQRTAMTVEPRSDTEVRILPFGRPSAPDSRLLQELNTLLEETRSFQQYFLRAELSALLFNLELEQSRRRKS